MPQYLTKVQYWSKCTQSHSIAAGYSAFWCTLDCAFWAKQAQFRAHCEIARPDSQKLHTPNRLCTHHGSYYGVISCPSVCVQCFLFTFLIHTIRNKPSWITLLCDIESRQQQQQQQQSYFCLCSLQWTEEGRLCGWWYISMCHPLFLPLYLSLSLSVITRQTFRRTAGEITFSFSLQHLQLMPLWRWDTFL